MAWRGGPPPRSPSRIRSPGRSSPAPAPKSRLEAIFSLYRADSALARLNGAGRLDAPPFELLECLSLAADVHGATEGRFDPTVQPLRALFAARHSEGRAPDVPEIGATLERVGWRNVDMDAARVRFRRPGIERAPARFPGVRLAHLA